MRIPRWMHRAYAALTGYFWIECPRCGRSFGGHEWRSGHTVNWRQEAPYAIVGEACCPDCPGDPHPWGWTAQREYVPRKVRP